MALVINDRVKETSTTEGTITFNLAGAATGFDTFVSGIGDTNTTYYAIFLQGSTEWEVGLGTIGDATPDTLARTTVITSSNSDSKVDFSAGTKDVFCTLPASKAIYLDGSGNQVGGFTSLVDDTTPQLGGNLDIDGNSIVSTSNDDIILAPNGTGEIKLGSGSAAADITTNGAQDLIIDTYGGTDAGNITLIDGANGTISLTPNGTGVVAIGGSMNSSVSSSGKALVMGF